MGGCEIEGLYKYTVVSGQRMKRDLTIEIVVYT